MCHYAGFLHIGSHIQQFYGILQYTLKTKNQLPRKPFKITCQDFCASIFMSKEAAIMSLYNP